ncbi:MAG TPA: hypothetical protein PLN86_07590 [Candidatus Hydrogenedentes bacterium]|nr:hypothetical protein [Candidatus Hydrogenedentota bacterium]
MENQKASTEMREILHGRFLPPMWVFFILFTFSASFFCKPAFPEIEEGSLVLGIENAHFTLNGKPAFLLGFSYYGSLGIEQHSQIEEDLHAWRERGFNWFRVWATWDAFNNDVCVATCEAVPRQPFLERLVLLCQTAAKAGMVVDVTVTRGAGPNFPKSMDEHRKWVETLTKELKPFRNVYFDVGNERNIRDKRYVSMEEVGELISCIKRLDPGRLCTASHGGDITEDELRNYLEVGKVDFICPHRPRQSGSPEETIHRTQKYLETMAKLGKVVPVHYQEPFRRGYADWEPLVKDYLVDLEGALRGGAAGWCFHNGDTRRGSEERRPRRSFDMRPSEGTLWNQLDLEEKSFVEQAERLVADLLRHRTE